MIKAVANPLLIHIGRWMQLSQLSTHIHTNLKPETHTAKDGPNHFASSTITFSGGSWFQQDRLLAEAAAKVREKPCMQVLPCSHLSVPFTHQAAASSVLSALRDPGGKEGPSLMIVLTSVPEPDTCLQMLHAVRSQVQSSSSSSYVPIVGCSALKWSCWGSRGSGGVISSRSKESAGRFHVTVSAARLAPGIAVGSFESAGDSLPLFPPGFNLAKAFLAARNKRPQGSKDPSTLPQFLLFSHSESDLNGLRGRLDSLFSDGACLAAAAGSLSTAVRKTAVLNPHAPIGMNLIPTPDFPPPLPLPLPHQPPQSMAFYDESIQKSSGCTGLVFYPSGSAASSYTAPSLGLSPSSSALMVRILLGQDRFASLELPDSILTAIRPPPTDPGQFIALHPPEKNSRAVRSNQPSSIKNLPLFEISRDFVLFPGQSTQMRIFEKRYQYLMQQLVETGGILGLPVNGSRDKGVTASIQSYLLNGSEFYVTVEGSLRFEAVTSSGGSGGGGGKKGGVGRGPSSCRVVPSSFGLTSVNAQALNDESPKDEEESKAVMGLAKEAIKLLHEGASLAMVPEKDESAAKSSGLFLSALHLAGRGRSEAVKVPPVKVTLVKQSGPPPSSLTEEEPKEAKLETLPPSPSSYHPRLQSQLAERASQALDKRGWEGAMELSLLLGGTMPVEVEARKSWFSTLSTVTRLNDQVKRLREMPNLRLASSVEVLRLREGHPLRVMLGLPWTIESSR